ncbi:MAG: hypothetical protein ACFNOQ_03105 [Porphyromonas sp.]
MNRKAGRDKPYRWTQSTEANRSAVADERANQWRLPARGRSV